MWRRGVCSLHGTRRGPIPAYLIASPIFDQSRGSEIPRLRSIAALGRRFSGCTTVHLRFTPIVIRSAYRNARDLRRGAAPFFPIFRFCSLASADLTICMHVASVRSNSICENLNISEQEDRTLWRSHRGTRLHSSPAE